MMFLMIMIMIIVIVVNAQLNCKGNDYRRRNLFLRLSFARFLLCSDGSASACLTYTGYPAFFSRDAESSQVPFSD